jgi:hypothetical protein
MSPPETYSITKHKPRKPAPWTHWSWETNQEFDGENWKKLEKTMVSFRFSRLQSSELNIIYSTCLKARLA